MIDWIDFLIWWAASFVAGAVVAVASTVNKLARLEENEPQDEALKVAWLRRKKWLAITEISAVPAFATLANSGRLYFDASPVVGVIATMFLGFVGFAMLIDGARFLFRSRVGLPTEGETK